jgi:hypothetical protein
MLSAEQKKIGGFIGLDLPLAKPVGRSAWDVMTKGGVQTFCAANAREVLANLLTGFAPSRIWYPAYCCPEIALQPKGIERHFYPVGDDLQPDAKWLKDRLASGDAVLAINYFGAPASAEFTDLTRARPDILWIEDCSQALDAGEAWGDWRFFSPRKIFGVPDGGIGVCHNATKTMRNALTFPAQSNLTVAEKLLPLLWRMEDGAEDLNELWYSSYQNAETLAADLVRHDVTVGMSGLTRRLLDAIDADAAIAARFANATLIHDNIPHEIRLWQTLPHPPLLGYPVRLHQRDAIAKKLSEDGIFCAIHWRALPVESATFPDEHRLSRSLLTLPCDQRYSPDDMFKIIDTIAKLL